MTRFLWDENTSHHILRAVRRARSDLDIVTVQQLGLAGAPDPLVLDRATADGRVLVTHDRTTILGILAARKRAGVSIPGVVVIQLSKASIGELADGLLFLADAAQPADWQTRYSSRKWAGQDLMRVSRLEENRILAAENCH